MRRAGRDALSEIKAADNKRRGRIPVYSWDTIQNAAQSDKQREAKTGRNPKRHPHEAQRYRQEREVLGAIFEAAFSFFLFICAFVKML